MLIEKERLLRATALMSAEELRELERLSASLALENEGFMEWLERVFPKRLKSGFAPHHLRYWKWIEALAPGRTPPPHVECWARGGGKTTTNELGAAFCCDKLKRRYPLVICAKQDKADEIVQNVAVLLEEMGIERRIGKYGYARGWRRQQLQADNGFNFSGFGLDVGQRGVKIEEYRPDWIIFDEIDELSDTIAAITKKVEIITKSILPAGSSDLAVSFTQNAIHRESIMSQMVDGRADFLLERNHVEIVPALKGFRVLNESEWKKEEEREEEKFFLTNGRDEEVKTDWTPIRAEGRVYYIHFGTPTWVGQGVDVCRATINRMGLQAFRTECQHEVYTNVPNARFDNEALTKTLSEVREGFHLPLRSGDTLRLLYKFPDLKNIFTHNSDEEFLKLWEYPTEGEEYILSADCSEGLNAEGVSDYDCAHILNAGDFSQAAVLRGRWESHEFAQLLDSLAKLFGGMRNTLLAVLRNKGESVLSHLINTHRWEKRLERSWGGLYYYDEQEVLNRVSPGGFEARKPGFPENVATKPVMITALSDAIAENLITLRDDKTLQECLTYVKLPGGKTGGMSGSNDDTVSSLAVGTLLLTIRYDRRIRKQTNEETKYWYDEELQRLDEREQRRRGKEEFGKRPKSSWSWRGRD